jgi:hypothetical protein
MLIIVLGAARGITSEFSATPVPEPFRFQSKQSTRGIARK